MIIMAHEVTDRPKQGSPFEMKRIGSANRYVVARESNIVRVDFDRTPDPPTPQFPGAGALRNHDQSSDHNDGCHPDRGMRPRRFGSEATMYSSIGV
jgi:hypothetical protein